MCHRFYLDELYLGIHHFDFKGDAMQVLSSASLRISNLLSIKKEVRSTDVCLGGRGVKGEPKVEIEKAYEELM